MSENYPLLSQEERDLFREAITGTRVLSQNNIVSHGQKRKLRQSMSERLFQRKIDALRYFSEECQPVLFRENSGCYCKPGVHHSELYTFTQGDYVPECFLDLHGLTQYQAKWKLAAFIVTCCYRRIRCACIIHGHGRDILKQRIPLWLSQSPWIQAFQQAPERWGGSAALLFLIDPDMC